MSSFIILTAKGEVKAAALGDVTAGVETAIGKALKRAKPPALVGTWAWQKYKLFLYGYKEGRTGTENKHELHEPHDELVLFGDAVIVASLDKSADKPAPFTAELYKKFYNSKGGGAYEDIEAGEDDGEEEEDDEEDIEEDEEEDFDDEGVEEDAVDEEDGNMDDDEEEDARPMLRIKPSSGFKKIAKWMHSPELVAEEYVL
jgi:hypothetical protein